MRFAVLIALLCMLAMPVKAWVNVTSLVHMCTSKDVDEQMMCLGYLQGALDADSLMVAYVSRMPEKYIAKFKQVANYEPACIPSGVTIGQLKRIFLAYVRSHPEKEHLHVAWVMNQAFYEAFPCDTRKAK